MNVRGAIFDLSMPTKSGALFVHNPTLQMRARARAAVRVWDCGGGDRTQLCLGLSSPRGADAGWPPPLVSPVSFRRATQTYKAIRRAMIQHSQASLRALAKRRYGINPKTVAKWKKRGSVADLPTGPKDAGSTVLSVEEEAVIVAFRRQIPLLPLDDCYLYAPQPTIPHLTRSSLHRCLQRHASSVSRLPQVEAARPRPSGSSRRLSDRLFPYRHRGGSRPPRRKLYLPCRHRQDLEEFAFVELRETVSRRDACTDFLRRLIEETVPYKVHTVLTDNGTPLH